MPYLHNSSFFLIDCMYTKTLFVSKLKAVTFQQKIIINFKIVLAYHQKNDVIIQIKAPVMEYMTLDLSGAECKQITLTKSFQNIFFLTIYNTSQNF